MKLKVSVITLILLLLFTTSVFAENINVSVNGLNISFTDATPFIDDNNRTQVPVRALSNALGCDVTWKQASEEVIITKVYDEGKCHVLSDINDNYVSLLELHLFINKTSTDSTANLSAKGTKYDGTIDSLVGCKWLGMSDLDTVPVIVSDRTYLPARYIAEFFGYSVDWDSSTMTVVINNKQ